MATVKMDVRSFGYSDVAEIYGLLAKEMGVTINDLNANGKVTFSNDWHKLKVSGLDEKIVEKFCYYVEDGEWWA